MPDDSVERDIDWGREVFFAARCVGVPVLEATLAQIEATFARPKKGEPDAPS
jgi:hypothetical protein